MHSTFKINYNININETNIPPTGPLKADCRLGRETHTKHFPPTRSLKAERWLGMETHACTHIHTNISHLQDRLKPIAS